MDQHKKTILEHIEAIGYAGLAEDLKDEALQLSYDEAVNHVHDNQYMIDDEEDRKAYRNVRHLLIKYFKYPHAKESLLYNSGGNVMWSLFRTGSDSVTVYYHDLEDFDILPSKAKYIDDLRTIADHWNPSTKQLNI